MSVSSSAVSEAEITGSFRRKEVKRMDGAPFTHPSTGRCGRVAREPRPGAGCYDPPIVMSSITKHRPAAAVGLGAEIQRLRRMRGLTQTQLGRPLTRAFVSAVEHGRCLPSLAAVALFAERLGVSPAHLLDPVKHELAALYTAGDATSRNTLAGP